MAALGHLGPALHVVAPLGPLPGWMAEVLWENGYAARHLNPGRYIAALVKPQFEAPKEQVGRGGVIKDPKVHAAVLGKMVNWAIGKGFRVRNICRTPILGDAGNQEFFFLLQKPQGSE